MKDRRDGFRKKVPGPLLAWAFETSGMQVARAQLSQ